MGHGSRLSLGVRIAGAGCRSACAQRHLQQIRCLGEVGGQGDGVAGHTECVARYRHAAGCPVVELVSRERGHGECDGRIGSHGIRLRGGGGSCAVDGDGCAAVVAAHLTADGGGDLQIVAVDRPMGIQRHIGGSLVYGGCLIQVATLRRIVPADEVIARQGDARPCLAALIRRIAASVIHHALGQLAVIGIAEAEGGCILGGCVVRIEGDGVGLRRPHGGQCHVTQLARAHILHRRGHGDLGGAPVVLPVGGACGLGGCPAGEGISRSRRIADDHRIVDGVGAAVFGRDAALQRAAAQSVGHGEVDHFPLGVQVDRAAVGGRQVLDGLLVGMRHCAARCGRPAGELVSRLGKAVGRQGLCHVIGEALLRRGAARIAVAVKDHGIRIRCPHGGQGHVAVHPGAQRGAAGTGRRAPVMPGAADRPVVELVARSAGGAQRNGRRIGDVVRLCGGDGGIRGACALVARIGNGICDHCPCGVQVLCAALAHFAVPVVDIACGDGAARRCAAGGCRARRPALEGVARSGRGRGADGEVLPVHCRGICRDIGHGGVRGIGVVFHREGVRRPQGIQGDIRRVIRGAKARDLVRRRTRRVREPSAEGISRSGGALQRSGGAVGMGGGVTRSMGAGEGCVALILVEDGIRLCFPHGVQGLIRRHGVDNSAAGVLYAAGGGTRPPLEVIARLGRLGGGDGQVGTVRIGGGGVGDDIVQRAGGVGDAVGTAAVEVVDEGNGLVVYRIEGGIGHVLNDGVRAAVGGVAGGPLDEFGAVVVAGCRHTAAQRGGVAGAAGQPAACQRGGRNCRTVGVVERDALGVHGIVRLVRRGGCGRGRTVGGGRHTGVCGTDPTAAAGDGSRYGEVAVDHALALVVAVAFCGGGGARLCGAVVVVERAGDGRLIGGVVRHVGSERNGGVHGKIDRAVGRGRGAPASAGEALASDGLCRNGGRCDTAGGGGVPDGDRLGHGRALVGVVVELRRQCLFVDGVQGDIAGGHGLARQRSSRCGRGVPAHERPAALGGCGRQRHGGVGLDAVGRLARGVGGKGQSADGRTAVGAVVICDGVGVGAPDGVHMHDRGAVLRRIGVQCAAGDVCLIRILHRTGGGMRPTGEGVAASGEGIGFERHRLVVCHCHFGHVAGAAVGMELQTNGQG